MKDKLIRKLDRVKETLNKYKGRESDLSVHGHWELGYYSGVRSTLENMLDDLYPYWDKEEKSSIVEESIDSKYVIYVSGKGYLRDMSFSGVYIPKYTTFRNEAKIFNKKAGAELVLASLEYNKLTAIIEEISE